MHPTRILTREQELHEKLSKQRAQKLEDEKFQALKAQRAQAKQPNKTSPEPLILHAQESALKKLEKEKQLTKIRTPAGSPEMVNKINPGKK
jgi:hypothetical protein